MKNFSRTILPWLLAALFAGAFLTAAFSRKKAPGAAPAGAISPALIQRKILYWIDPMTPGYKSDKPGKSPFMDMDLVPVYDDGSTGETREHAAAGYSPINVSGEKQQAIGVKVGKAQIRDLTKAIRAVGRVTFDETLMAQIHTKFEGYVEKLYVNYGGQTVRKGQPLLSIYSPELLATQEEYLLAVRARREFRGSANPELARGGLDLYGSARQRLLLWDISPAEIERLERTGKPSKALTLYSPVSGFVLEKNAVQGARVMPSDILFSIAGVDRVWVQADVYESEAQFVRVGQTARMSLSYVPGRTWTGKVAFIAPVFEEKTRTVKVRLEFANPDGLLKPEMYADVSLERPLGRVVTVPDSAVLSTGTRALVFVAKGAGRFEPREVRTGAKVDGYYEIREGIAPGDEVVTQGNFLIDSESRLRAALGGLTATPTGSPSAKKEQTALAPSAAKAEHQH